MLRGEHRLPVGVGPVGIGLDHQCGVAVDHPVHEHLHPAGIEHGRGIALAHQQGFVELGQRVGVTQVAGDLHPAQQVAFLLQLVQQFHLVQIAVHVVQAGQPMAGAVAQPLRNACLSRSRSPGLRAGGGRRR